MKKLLLLLIGSLLSVSQAQAALKCTSVEGHSKVKLLFVYQGYVWVQKNPGERPVGYPDSQFTGNVNTQDSYRFNDKILIDMFSSEEAQKVNGVYFRRAQVRFLPERYPTMLNCEVDKNVNSQSFRAFFQ